MTLLIGREAWYCGGAVVEHGTIIEHTLDPIPLVTMLIDRGERRLFSARSVTLTPQAAADECDDNARYWKMKSEELRRLNQ